MTDWFKGKARELLKIEIQRGTRNLNDRCDEASRNLGYYHNITLIIVFEGSEAKESFLHILK